MTVAFVVVLVAASFSSSCSLSLSSPRRLRLAACFHRFVAYLMTCLFHRNFLLHLACIHRTTIYTNHGLHQTTAYTTHPLQQPLVNTEQRLLKNTVYTKPQFTPHTAGFNAPYSASGVCVQYIYIIYILNTSHHLSFPDPASFRHQPPASS